MAVDFPPWSGGMRSEHYAAAGTLTSSIALRASAGVR